MYNYLNIQRWLINFNNMKLYFIYLAFYIKNIYICVHDILDRSYFIKSLHFNIQNSNDK